MKNVSQRQRVELWLNFSAFVVIVLGFIGGSVWLFHTLMDEKQLPLTGVIIQGERVYTSDNDIVQVLVGQEIGSFFKANTDAIRQRIETLPWVYSASIRKEWPETLRVFIVEQQPLAVWNNEKLLNNAGDLFNADPKDVQGRLPELRGPAEQSAEVFLQYQKLQTLLAHGGHRVVQLAMSERFAVNLWLSSGIELRLGREAQLERVQRFMELLPLIQHESEREIAYIDLRYDTGVAVGWHDLQPGGEERDSKK